MEVNFRSINRQRQGPENPQKRSFLGRVGCWLSLTRSIKQLIETVEGLAERGIGLRSLTETIDTTTSCGKLIFYIRCSRCIRALDHPRADGRGLKATRDRGQLGGRPAALSQDDIVAAKALLTNPDDRRPRSCRGQRTAV